MPSSSRLRVTTGLLLGLIVAPALLMAWIVWRYGVDVPVHDSWHMVFMFRKVVSGAWTWSDVFGQVNESRLPFPKLVVFGLAMLTDWNVRAELFLQQALLAFLVLAVFRIGRATVPGAEPVRLAALAGTSMLLYTLVQTQNPLWGIQFIVFIPPLCLAVSSLVALASWNIWTRRVVAAAACTIGMYSFSIGLGLFILAPLVVEGAHAASLAVAGKRVTRRSIAAALAFWGSCAVAAAWLYFRDYQRPPWHPPVTVALERPLDAVKAFVWYFGGLINWTGARRRVPFLFGAAELAVAAFVFGLVVSRRRNAEFVRVALPWIAFASFGIVAGGLIVAGRLGFAPEYSLSSRYAAFAAWVPIGLLHLVALLLARPDGLHPGSRSRRALVWCASGFGAVLLTLHTIASVSAFGEYPRLRVERLQAKAAVWLAHVTPQEDLRRLVWLGSWPGSTAQLGDWLGSRGWLRPPLLRDFESAYRSESLAPGVGWVEAATRRGDGLVAFSGWCVLPARREACDAVLVTVVGADSRDTLYTVAFPDQRRPDVAESLGTRASLNYGWTVWLPADASVRTLRFWAVDVGGPRLNLLSSNLGPRGAVPAGGDPR